MYCSPVKIFVRSCECLFLTSLVPESEKRATCSIHLCETTDYSRDISQIPRSRKNARTFEIEKVKEKVPVRTDASSELAFNNKRCTQPTEISKSSIQHQLNDGPLNYPESNLALFYSKMSVRVLHKFLGFLPEMEFESGTELKFVESTTTTVARLDAYIATTAICLRNDGTNKVWGHGQKLYHYTFTLLLPNAYF